MNDYHPSARLLPFLEKKQDENEKLLINLLSLT